MKTTYLFLALFLSTSLVAQKRVNYKQPLNYSKSGEVFLREILHFSGKSKEELTKLSEEWFVRKFDGELIQFDSKSEKQYKIIGRGFYGYPIFALSSDLSELSYVLTISIKEEKIKVQMDELFILGQTTAISGSADLLYPKPAHEVISDKAMYKRNGKARTVKRKHKEKILDYWHSLLKGMDGFFRTNEEEEDNW